jgi:hypothetical protein
MIQKERFNRDTLKVVILTPCLRRPAFLKILRKMLDNQTFQHFTHIILEEDWSYQEHGLELSGSQFVQLPCKEKEVYSIAKKMNYGLSLIEPDVDLVFKMDSDNYFGPLYLEKYINYFEQHPECILSFSKREILYNISEREYGNLEVVQDGNVCFRRELLDKVKFRESFGAGELGEDAWFIWDTESAFGKQSIQQIVLDKDYMVIKHVPKIQPFTNYKTYKPYSYPKETAIEVIKEGKNLCTYDVSCITDNNCSILKDVVSDEDIVKFYESFFIKYDCEIKT